MSHWRTLDTEAQLEELREASYSKPQILFKHSTRCGISAQAHHDLEEAIGDLARHSDVYYLDLLRYRPVSDAIAKVFGVPHQSPQVIMLKEGKVVYHASHFSISPDLLLRHTA